MSKQEVHFLHSYFLLIVKVDLILRLVALYVAISIGQSHDRFIYFFVSGWGLIVEGRSLSIVVIGRSQNEPVRTRVNLDLEGLELWANIYIYCIINVLIIIKILRLLQNSFPVQRVFLVSCSL